MVGSMLSLNEADISCSCETPVGSLIESDLCDLCDLCVSKQLSGDLENHFPRLPGFDRPNRIIRRLQWKAVRDHGSWVELARPKEARHQQPRVVHPPTDDAVDGEA